MLTLETLFDQEFYLTTYPDVAPAIDRKEFRNAFDHFIEEGQFLDYEPNPLFDSQYYQQGDPELLTQIQGEFTTAAKHFIDFGQFEPRSPNPLFDPIYYLERYPDIKSGFLQAEINPFEHFFLQGQYEGRNPSINFDTNFYQTRYPDVLSDIQSGLYNTFFEHFWRQGLKEERLGIAPAFQDDLTQTINIDTLLGQRTIVGLIDAANPINIYEFIIPNFNSEVSIIMNQMKANLDLDLIYDLNNNRAVQSNEIVASSANLGLTPESIELDKLPSGTYFLRVSPRDGSTHYLLNLSATPI